MKRMISALAALILMMSLAILPAAAEEKETVRVGALSMLNMTEEEMSKFLTVRAMIVNQLVQEKQAVSLRKTDDNIPNFEVQFYDSLESMVMGLIAGEIKAFTVYQTTAQYLCANNEQLVQVNAFEEENPSLFASLMLNGPMANDFSFMMMESNTELRDEFNAAIEELKTDDAGTLLKIMTEQILTPISGEEIIPVQMPVIEGAPTIRVAVTGALPPMDYVAPDGTPAGYTTAVLAEISKKINKNIELVVVDALGRATALASGNVDVVFWTRTSSAADEVARQIAEPDEETIDAISTTLTDEQMAVFQQFINTLDFASYGKADMPEGTIITKPYYSDQLVMVGRYDDVQQAAQ